jgi:hypothetical protein
MQANGVSVVSLEVCKHAIIDVNMLIEMVENDQVHICKGKNLAQEFDASNALDGPMKFGGQSNGETLNGYIIVGVDLQQPLVVVGVSTCKSLPTQVSVPFHSC